MMRPSKMMVDRLIRHFRASENMDSCRRNRETVRHLAFLRGHEKGEAGGKGGTVTSPSWEQLGYKGKRFGLGSGPDELLEREGVYTGAKGVPGRRRPRGSLLLSTGDEGWATWSPLQPTTPASVSRVKSLSHSWDELCRA